MTARYPLVLNGTSIQELQSGDTLNANVLGFTPIDAATKGVANGVASLDSAGLVPSTQLPSYVDDVLEFANVAAFPVTGESGKIYVAVDTSKTYRWSGSVYIEISASPGTTDALVEGTTNLYFTQARARQSISVTQNLTYDSGTGVITGPNLSGYLTSSTAASTYQPLDSDLTAIAALSPTADNFIVGNGTTWILETPAQARTSLGATTVGGNLLTLSNPSAVTFPRFNADNTVSSLSAADFRTAIGAGTGNGDVTLTGTQTLTNKTITGLRETRVAMPASDIDLSTGNYFTRTISGTTTLTVSNIPTSGTAQSFILDLTNGGSATINWFSGVKWAGGTAPTLTSAGRDVLGFFTHDGGTNWTGLVLGKDVK